MASYEVVTPLHHNGKKYKKGSTVELEAKEAAAIPNAVKAIAAPKGPKDAGKPSDK